MTQTGDQRERVRYRAPLIVAYQEGEHRILSGGSIVVEGDRIIAVGPGDSGAADREVVLPDQLIAPGLISTHAHLHESPIDKFVGAEDFDRSKFWNSSLYEVLSERAVALTEDVMTRAVDVSMVELIANGVTTVVQLGEVADYIADAVEAAGLRAFIGYGYRSAAWKTSDGHRLVYEWDEDAGRREFDKAANFTESIRGRAGGRITGVVYPAQVDTCTPDLLVESRRLADSLGVPLVTHAAQSQLEFAQILERHDRTPIEWLSEIGFLGERTILGHVVFIADSVHVNYPGDDLRLLAESGTTVAYCPWVLARTGILMDSYPRYLRSGVNVTLGTDTCSQSMVEAMRWAVVGGKIAHRRSAAVTARDAFDSATVRAADALGRADLGRISAGAKADLCFWRTDTLSMSPVRDPVRNLVYYAQPSDLSAVMVDGRFVMDGGAVLTCDRQSAVARLAETSTEFAKRWAGADWAGRELSEFTPPTYHAFS
jgi:5-methylthioadenosine/S-adenosylhomocysteine deaminase